MLRVVIRFCDALVKNLLLCSIAVVKAADEVRLDELDTCLRRIVIL